MVVIVAADRKKVHMTTAFVARKPWRLPPYISQSIGTVIRADKTASIPSPENFCKLVCVCMRPLQNLGAAKKYPEYLEIFQNHYQSRRFSTLWCILGAYSTMAMIWRRKCSSC